MTRHSGGSIMPSLAKLRQEQARAVMKHIGPLLDAWEAIPNDVRTDLEYDLPDLWMAITLIARAVGPENK